MDGSGVATDFKNTIIIATSNAGSRWMAEHPAPADDAGKEIYKQTLIDEILRERAFSPEFFNRFDEAILFYPPSAEEVRQIAMLMLGSIIKDIGEKRGIQVKIESGVIDLLAERGFNPEFGAREMRRTITQTVETYLANYLLQHEVKRGQEMLVRRADLERL
jgi:ATP-dependent Clp protease ATP-binding subunit ClpA